MTKKKTTPYKQMTEEQKALLLFLKGHLTHGVWMEFSPSSVAEHLGTSMEALGANSRRLQEIGYISVRGKGEYREVKLNKKGAMYGATLTRTIDKSALVPATSSAEKELAEIRELVKPRPWETTSEAVQAMMDWIRRHSG